MDYFRKWIEDKPLAKIKAQKIEDFIWKSIVCRFSVLFAIVTGNRSQFMDKNFKGFYDRLGIRQTFSYVERPQSNRQPETANKLFPQGLKKRLDQAKGKWTEELHGIL